MRISHRPFLVYLFYISPPLLSNPDGQFSRSDAPFFGIGEQRDSITTEGRAGKIHSGAIVGFHPEQPTGITTMGTHPLRHVLLPLLLCAGFNTLAAQPTTDAQGDVGIGTTRPHPSALVELTSDTKGFLPPRMNTIERDAIPVPAEGLMIFNTTLDSYQYWNGTTNRWETLLVSETAAGGDPWLVDGNVGQTAWDGLAGNFVGRADNADLVLKTENAEIEFWTGNTERAAFDADGNFYPATEDSSALGTDSNRWKEFYVNGTGLHIGPAGGEFDNAEFHLGYEAGRASMNVNGGENEIAVTTAATEIGNDLIVRGDMIAKEGHLRCTQASGPTSVGAGSNVASTALGSATDVAGFLSISTSGTPNHGPQATVTFNTPYGNPPIVTLTPADPLAPGVGAYVTRTATGFVVGFMGMPAPSTSYHFFYQVIQTEQGGLSRVEEGT